MQIASTDAITSTDLHHPCLPQRWHNKWPHSAIGGKKSGFPRSVQQAKQFALKVHNDLMPAMLPLHQDTAFVKPSVYFMCFWNINATGNTGSRRCKSLQIVVKVAEVSITSLACPRFVSRYVLIAWAGDHPQRAGPRRAYIPILTHKYWCHPSNEARHDDSGKDNCAYYIGDTMTTLDPD